VGHAEDKSEGDFEVGGYLYTTNNHTYYNDSEGESTTSSTSWQNKVILTFTPVKAGDYIIEWYAEIYPDISGENADIRVIDPDTNEIGFQSEFENSYQAVSGFIKQTLTATSKTFTLQYRGSGIGSAHIRRSRLLARRVI
jgi:hypothetical protein